MLIKAGSDWIDPTKVRAVEKYGNERCTVYWKRHGSGITIDARADVVALAVNEALSNPLFYED